VWSDGGVAWLLLAGAIVTELFGTLGLRRVADGFLWWAVALIAVLYTTSFTFMTLALRQLNVAVVYAIWSAFGTAAVSIAGVLLFEERLNVQAVAGLVLIVAGVVVLVASGTVRHG
jgi:multidrug transporter EmrE-like cation transporter